jgi:hypothetical protein
MDRHRGLEMLAHRGFYQTRVEQVRRDGPSLSSLFTSLCAAHPTAITRAGALASMPSSRLNRLSADANRRRSVGVAQLASDLLENVELISAEQLAQAGMLTRLEYLPRLGETLLASRGDVQERGASVARVGVPFDQPLLFHTVCEATEAACR